MLVEPQDGGPRLWFQLVPEAKRVKNRVHMDLYTDDLEAETVRLVALGAVLVARHEKNTEFADPEGNEFCLVPLGSLGS